MDSMGTETTQATMAKLEEEVKTYKMMLVVAIESNGEDIAKRLEYWQDLSKVRHLLFDEQKKTAEYEKILNALKDMVEVQGRDGNWNCDEYMHGMYNGMEFMLSIVESREPQYRSKPEKGWLSENPRNYTLEPEATQQRSER